MPSGSKKPSQCLSQLSTPVCPALQIICLFLQPINDYSDSGDYFQLVEPMGYRIPSCPIYMGCSATLGDCLSLPVGQ